MTNSFLISCFLLQTVVLEMAIARLLHESGMNLVNRKIIYIAPIKVGQTCLKVLFVSIGATQSGAWERFVHDTAINRRRVPRQRSPHSRHLVGEPPSGGPHAVPIHIGAWSALCFRRRVYVDGKRRMLEINSEHNSLVRGASLAAMKK